MPVIVDNVLAQRGEGDARVPPHPGGGIECTDLIIGPLAGATATR
jgi:hypothetical protein